MVSAGHRAVHVFMGLLVLVTALGIGPAFAADPAPPAQAHSTEPTVRGVVRASSATALSLDVGTPGKERRFAVNDQTVVMSMKPMKRIAVTELRKGDLVTVAYVEDGGRAVAKRVWRRPAQPDGGGAAGKVDAAARR